jgi:hypothetical protein
VRAGNDRQPLQTIFVTERDTTWLDREFASV